MADSTNEVEKMKMQEEILRLRTELCWSYRAIADEVGTSIDNVRYYIKKYVNETKAKHLDMLDERFVSQDDTINYLLSLVLERLKLGYDRDSIKLAITLLERQSKLHGLDRNSKEMNQETWMEKASNEELVKYAESMGLRLPTNFALAV